MSKSVEPLSDSKRCGHCREVKPRSEFHRSRKTKDGLQGRCKVCQGPSEEHRERSRRNYAANRERYRKTRARWYQEHKAEHTARVLATRTKEQARDWARARRARLRPAQEAKRAAELAAYLERIARDGKPCSMCKETLPLESFEPDTRYRSGRKSQCRSCRMLASAQVSSKRRALIRAATVHPVSFPRILERDGYVCHLCGGPVDPDDLDFDHVVPLSKGGAHSEENIRVSHRTCNRRKGAHA